MISSTGSCNHSGQRVGGRGALLRPVVVARTRRPDRDFSSGDHPPPYRCCIGSPATARIERNLARKIVHRRRCVGQLPANTGSTFRICLAGRWPIRVRSGLSQQRSPVSVAWRTSWRHPLRPSPDRARFPEPLCQPRRSVPHSRPFTAGCLHGHLVAKTALSARLLPEVSI